MAGKRILAEDLTGQHRNYYGALLASQFHELRAANPDAHPMHVFDKLMQKHGRSNADSQIVGAPKNRSTYWHNEIGDGFISVHRNKGGIPTHLTVQGTDDTKSTPSHRVELWPTRRFKDQAIQSNAM